MQESESCALPLGDSPTALLIYHGISTSAMVFYIFFNFFCSCMPNKKCCKTVLFSFTTFSFSIFLFYRYADLFILSIFTDHINCCLTGFLCPDLSLIIYCCHRTFWCNVTYFAPWFFGCFLPDGTLTFALITAVFPFWSFIDLFFTETEDAFAYWELALINTCAVLDFPMFFYFLFTFWYGLT